MRTFILFALVALAYASSLQENVFRNNRQYVYKYEGQTLTGIPGTSKQYSGLKIKCLVKLTFKDNDKVIMQLENVELGKLNNNLPSTQMPDRQVPLEYFERIDSEESQVIMPELRKPSQFIYVQGEIRQLEYPLSEPEWSVDIKRGILNIFQLNINKQNLPYEPSQPIEDNLLRTMEENQAFKVKEDSTSGRCDVLYTVNKLPIYEKYTIRQPSLPVMNITKVKNFTSCEGFPMILNTTMNVLNCTDCQTEKTEPLETFSHTSYNCTGNKKNFMIETAKTSASYVFVPYQEQSGAVVTYIRQTLKIVYAGRIESQVPDMHSTLKRSGLRSHALDEYNHGEEGQHHSRNINVKEMILSLLEKLKQEFRMPSSLSYEIPTHLLHLIGHMRHANEEELFHIYQRVKNNEPLKKYFIDTLPILGSKIAIKILKQEFERQQISVPHGVQILSQLSFTSSKQVEAVDEMLSLCQLSMIKSKYQLKKACWLSFGNIVYNTCEKPMEHGRYSLCPQEKLETYRKVLAHGITSPVKKEQLMCLSAISNAGLQNSLKDLVYIISDSRRPLEVRLSAVYALNRIAETTPKKVEQVLLPIYMNLQEHYELRIACINIIIAKCQPSYPVLEVITKQLMNEPNKQVGSYVFSLLEEVSNTSIPCYKKIAQDMKKVLRFTKPLKRGMHYSKTLHVPFLPRYIRNLLNIQPVWNSQVIGSNTTLIPRALHANLEAAGFGKFFNMFGIGIRSQGIENILPLLKASGDLSDLMRHPKNIDSIRNELRQLKESMKFAERATEEPSMTFWLDLFGSRLNMFTLNMQTIQEFIASNFNQKLQEIESLLRNGVDVSFTKVLPLMYSDRVIPTELGLPLRLHLSGVVAIKNTGHVRVNIQPRMSENKIPREIQAEIDIHPTILGQIYGNMTTKLSIIETGVSIVSKTKISTPLNGKIVLDLSTKTLKKEFRPPTTDHQVFNVQVKPVTFVKKTPWTKFTSESPTQQISEKCWQKTIYGQDIAEPKLNVKRYEWPMFGTEYTFLTKTVSHIPGAPFPPMSGKQEFSIFANKIHNAPEIVEVLIKYENNKPTKFWTSSSSEESQEIVPEEMKKFNSEESLEMSSEKPWYQKMFGKVFSSEESRSVEDRSISSESEEWLKSMELPTSEMRFNSRESGSSESQYRPNSEESPEWKKSAEFRFPNSQQKFNSFESESSESQDRSSSEESSKWKKSEEYSFPSSERVFSSESQEFGSPESREFGSSESQDLSNSQSESQESQEFGIFRNPLMSREVLSSDESSPEEYENSNLRPINSNQQVKRQLTIVVRAKGSSQPRQLISQLTWTCSKDYTLHKMEVKVKKQSPESSEDLSNFVFFLDGEIFFPTSSRPLVSWYEQMKSNPMPNIKSLWKVAFGPNGESKIRMQSFSEKSREQLIEEEMKYYKDKPVYKQCMKDLRHGSRSRSPACRELSNYLNQHRQLKVEISYERMPAKVLNFTANFLRYVEGILLPYTDVSYVNVHQPNDKIWMKFTVMNNSRVMDAMIRTPKPFEKIVKFNKVPLPFSLEPTCYSPVTTSQFRGYIDVMTNNYYKPMCKVSNNEVQTFDKVNVGLPETDCYQVLAKDCSPEEAYVVLMSKRPSSNKKAFMIYTAGKKIEIIPEHENQQIIRVNGEHVQISQGKKFIVRQESKDYNSKPVVTISMLSPTEVFVHCYQTGLKLRTDGYTVELQVDQYYRSKQCGLCGNFDGEEINELQGPNGEYYESKREFVSSYIVPSESCNHRQIYRESSLESGSASVSSSESLEISPVLTTVVREEERSGEKEICFSTTPVRRCSDGLVAVSSTMKRVPFHCLPAHSNIAHELVREAERQPLYKMQYKTEDVYHHIRIDSQCQRI